MLPAALLHAVSLVPALVAVVGIGCGAVSIARRDRRLAFFAVFAGLSCLPAGFVGTVAGMIVAFGAIRDVDPALKAQVLADGIDAASRATLVGIVGTFLVLPLAVPALVRSRPADPS